MGKTKSLQRALQADILDTRMQSYAQARKALHGHHIPLVQVVDYGWELTLSTEVSESDRRQKQHEQEKRSREDALSASGREGDKRKQLCQVLGVVAETQNPVLAKQ